MTQPLAAFAPLAPLAQLLVPLIVLTLAYTWACGHLPPIRSILPTWRPGRCAAPIHVLVADLERRQGIERTLRTGLWRLQQALGPAFPGTSGRLVVLVQQVLAQDEGNRQPGQLGDRRQVVWRDGRQQALVRLALQVGARERSSDELLAALADHCLALAFPVETLEEDANSSGVAPGPVVAVEMPRRRTAALASAHGGTAPVVAAPAMAPLAMDPIEAMVLPPDPLVSPPPAGPEPLVPPVFPVPPMPPAPPAPPMPAVESPAGAPVVADGLPALNGVNGHAPADASDGLRRAA